MITKINFIQPLGERVMARSLNRQVNELHIKTEIFNQCPELADSTYSRAEIADLPWHQVQPVSEGLLFV